MEGGRVLKVNIGGLISRLLDSNYISMEALAYDREVLWK